MKLNYYNQLGINFEAVVSECIASKITYVWCQTFNVHHTWLRKISVLRIALTWSSQNTTCIRTWGCWKVMHCHSHYHAPRLECHQQIHTTLRGQTGSDMKQDAVCSHEVDGQKLPVWIRSYQTTPHILRFRDYCTQKSLPLSSANVTRLHRDNSYCDYSW